MTQESEMGGEQRTVIMAAAGRTVSQSHGRLRVRLEREHRDRPALMAHIKENMARVEGVKSVDVNEATGSILIHHDPGVVSHATLQKTLQDLGVILLDEGLEASEYSEFAAKLLRVVDAVDQWIKKVTGRTVDLRMLVPIGFTAGGIALAIVNGGFGIMDIPAFVFVWIGFDAFVQLHKSRREPRQVRALPEPGLLPEAQPEPA